MWFMKVALRDKSALQAQVASLQKTNYDISRSKNILQERAANSVDARKATSLQYKLENASQQLEMNQKEIHKLNSELDTSTRQLWQDLTETQDERSQLLARVMDLGMKSIFTVFCEHYVLHASTYMRNVVQPHSRPLQFLGIGRN